MIRFSGRSRSSLIIGGQGIRARKLRTLLSMLSLFLGVQAVVVVQAGSAIGERAMLANIELTEGIDGTLRMWAPASEQSTPIVLDSMRGRGDAVAAIFSQAIIGEPNVTPINPGGMPFDQAAQMSFAGPDGGMVVNGNQPPPMICDRSGCHTFEDPNAGAPRGQAVELQLVALTGDIRQFRPFRPVSGNWLDFTTTPSLSPALVLNKEAAKGLSQYRVPAEMRIEGATANPTPHVVGVVDDANSQPTAYVRAGELANWLPADKLGANGGIQVLISPTANDVVQTLQTRLTAAGAPRESLQAMPIESRKQMTELLTLMRWVFLGMAALVLLIGVAGVLNVGLATVGERVEEFALRRAVGTPRSLLASIVLAETLITGLFTAALAIGVGVVGLKAVGVVLGGREPFLQNLDFPWQAGVAGVAAGLIAGVLGGFIPAIRAARIPIATVMRA